MARRKVRTLQVWLHDVHVATLSEPSTYRYRLTFTAEALDVFGDGARVLSLSLPISTRPIEDHVYDRTQQPVSAFLEGLLPEGNLRTQIAETLKVVTIDKMALLEQVGAECAGAVQFLPEGDLPAPGEVRVLSATEVDRLVGGLPTYRLPDGAAPQASLAGIQDKVLLTEIAGGWGWPENGAASTHLIKPEPTGTQAVGQLVQTEDWAMRVATAAGLNAAETRLETFDDRPAIVVRRYDRLPHGERLHQEDFCQALGLSPEAKYESFLGIKKTGSRLRQLTRLAAPRSPDPDEFRRHLLSLITFNIVIGNGDAHSKNYSVLLGRRGEVSLAPLYDSAPTYYLAPRFSGTGHLINGRSNLDWVDADDLVAEARTWGIAQKRARTTVDSVLEATWQATHTVALPQGTDDVLVNLEKLWARRSWRPPTA